MAKKGKGNEHEILIIFLVFNFITDECANGIFIMGIYHPRHVCRLIFPVLAITLFQQHFSYLRVV